MRIKNDSMISSPVDISTTQNIAGMYIGHVAMFAVQLVWTGTPAGNFKLQGSCDEGQPNATTEAERLKGVTNWSDVGPAAITVSAAGSLIINVADPAYMFVRVVYTATGSGTTPSLTVARISTKGI